jgi:hypothetical protein
VVVARRRLASMVACLISILRGNACDMWSSAVGLGDVVCMLRGRVRFDAGRVCMVVWTWMRRLCGGGGLLRVPLLREFASWW